MAVADKAPKTIAYIPQELKDWAIQAAADRYTSLSGFIIQALVHYRETMTRSRYPDVWLREEQP